MLPTKLTNYYHLIESPCFFVSVQFRKNDERRYTYKSNIDLQINDYVVVPTVNGLALAQVMQINIRPLITLDYPLKWIAAKVDLAMYNINTDINRNNLKEFNNTSEQTKQQTLIKLAEEFFTTKDGPDYVKSILLDSFELYYTDWEELQVKIK